RFVGPLIESAYRHCRFSHHDILPVVFTDDRAFDMPGMALTYRVPSPGRWPMPALKKYHLILDNNNGLRSLDYVFLMDADMLFNDTVGDEILGDRVATLHPR